MRITCFGMLTRALALLLLAMVVVTARAEVRLPDGELYEQMDDLQVKVMGGFVTVSRSWFRNQWFFNSAWAPLKFTFDSLDGSVKSIERSGWVYERKTPDVFVFDKRNSIRATASGYRWQDRRGNFIEYDAQGRIQSYGDRNDVRVSFRYDAQGHLSSVLDQFSTPVLFFEWSGDRLAVIRDLTDRRVQYSYSGTRLVGVADVLGNVWRYDYESSGRLNSLIDAEGRERKVTYFANGRVASVIEADGIATQYGYDYDSAKRHIYCKISHPDGRVEERWYDLRANLVRHDINGRTRLALTTDLRTRTRTDENGAQVVDELDEFDNVIRHVNADGTTELYEYDSVFTNLLRYTDEAGVVTQNEYDAKGNLIRTIALGRPEARVTEYSYDAYGNVIVAKRLAGPGSDTAEILYAYDDKGNETQLTDPEGNFTRYEYNVMGEGTRTTDGRGKLWLSEYDIAGQLLREIDPLGNATSYVLDKVGNVIAATNARGKLTRFEYDARDRMRRMIDPYGNADEMQYSAQGQLINTIDRARRSERMEYDALGRLIRKLDAKGNATQLIYSDPGGAEVSAFGPTRIVYPTFENQLKYDKRNRVVLDTTLFGEEGLVTRYRYDLRGQIDAVTDANGKTAFYEYDALGRLVKLTDTIGSVTTYTYDNRNNLTAVRAANGHQYTFAYDRANRLLRETRPRGESTRYRYDETDNLLEITRPAGQRVQYDYDDAGRLTGVRHLPVDAGVAPTSYSFAYDPQDNLTAWSDGQFSATLSYDDLDRKIAEKVDYGAFALTYGYSYTANDFKKTLTLPSGVTFTYSYDDNDELAAVDIPGEGAITVNEFQWRAPKRVSLPGGTTQELGYDGHLKLESLRVISPAQQVVVDLHNRYGRLEEINRRELDGTTTEYGYDNEQRLTRVAPQGAPERNLTLDPLANRSADSADPSTWSYDENNRLIQRGTTHYAYDDNGNIVTKTDAAQITRYFYDGQNRLIRIEDGTGSVIATYGYDPFDRRLWKEVSGVRRYFLYADEGLLAEYTADGGEIFAYGWRPDAIWGAYPLFIKSASQYFYAHNDQLGTPLKLTDKGGNVVWAAKYDEFGAMTLAPGASIVNNLRFAGQYFDQESGLHYNFRRYYDPGIGRYITEDPIGLEGGINLYAYVNGDPGNRIDPTGEVDAFDFTKAAIKFVARRNLVGMAGEFIFEWAMCFAGCMGMSTLIDFINGDCLRPGEDAGPCAISCAVPPLLRRWKWFKPPPCFRNSFPGDTLVHTEEGLKPIKDIKVGDKVLAWAEWKDETAYKRVTHVISGEREYPLVKITLRNGEVIEATPGHPLYVHGDGWRDVQLIKPGALLDLKDGKIGAVSSVSEQIRRAQVFNLEVADYHTFIAGPGFLAHNATNPPIPASVAPYQMDLFPKQAYDRVRDYGHTRTSAQRASVPAGTSYDHNPTLVKHYFEGDGNGGLAGHNMTQPEREAFAKSLNHGQPATIKQQQKQGGRASNYSKKWKKAFCLR